MLLPSIFRNNFVDDLFDGFDDLFSFPSFMRVPTSRLMTTNVKEVGDEYLLETELPGYDKKNISATLDRGYLTISATREDTKHDNDKKGKYLRQERYLGSCKRSFYVGDNLEEEDIKASFENGILKISFPKNKEVATLDERKGIPIE